MSIEEVLQGFRDANYIKPRFFRANKTFNGRGTSLYYYIYGKDVQEFVAGLKLDIFDRVRFTNYKKPHVNPEYYPYFDKFHSGWSCEFDEFDQEFTTANPYTIEAIAKMAQHWNRPVEEFKNTLLLAYELLWDAEDEGWLGFSWWEGGVYKGQLPPAKR